MSKRPQPSAPPRTRAEALARVARLQRQVRTLQQKLESSTRRADVAVGENVEGGRALAGSLEQQAATAEILRVMSGSPADVQPVLDVIARHAVRLCEGYFSAVFLSDGERIHVRATHNFPPEWSTELRTSYPAPLAGNLRLARVVRECRLIHVLDMQDDQGAPEETRRAQVGGYRTWICVPFLGSSRGVGAIAVARRERQAFSDTEIELLQTFAAQAVIALENARLFKELEIRNRDLAEALEQQTATAEILRVIGTSPVDTQPVFDVIARSGVSVCGAHSCTLFVVDGDMLRVAATHGVPAERVERFRTQFPVPVSAKTEVTQLLHDRRIVHLVDIEHNPAATPQNIENARLGGYRTRLMVPMLRGDSALGLIAVTHQAPIPFSDQQVALLQTFADQAVIAIENVRLFKELEARNHDLTETLEQQTATSEILRAISSNPSHLQPVLDTIAENSARVCGAHDATVHLLDANRLRHAAHYGSVPVIVAGLDMPLSRNLVGGRAVLERRPIQVDDLSRAEDFPEGREFALQIGFKSTLAVPLLREHVAIGVVTIRRLEAHPFSDQQVALLQTFADQAVIAIENVRLFKELEARTRELTETLEYQTATSDVLNVISRSPTDVQPVFDMIAESAARLCDAQYCFVYRFEGQLLHFVAHHGLTAEVLEINRRAYPAPPSRMSVAARAVLERSVVQIPDVNADPDYALGAMAAAGGYRSAAAVPILRDGLAIGSIAVTRAQAGLLPERQIELLKTFADQAVIAVENVRLFKELQARTAELTQSVEKLTALGEVSRAVSSTLDVETVLDTIVSRASQLAGAAGCSIYEYDAATQQFELRATHNDDTEFVEALRAVPLRKGEGLMGRAAEMREPIQIPDITQPGAYESSVRDTLIRFGYRALLSVPLLREDHIIGSLSFNRKEAGEFPPEVVDVLKTFATQSALAIQNARLFREIADKSAQLEAASRHKSEFLANMSHELRTPLNAIIGFSEVLTERMFGELNDKQDEYLKDIHASGQHLLSLINDILDLSKIEAGRMELERSEFDLPNAIENALILVRERASRRGIRLGHTIDERLGMIGGDERKVKQVLLNLLSNALKFTPEGGRVDVGARLDDHVAEVSVTDTGIGIAPADQDAVFEEFRQVGTADKKAEGTGLGLALSRKFIELHGGRIWVKSELGTGSTFTFTLPLTTEQRNA